jgi:hypothetical protein
MKLGLLPHVPEDRDIQLASVYSTTTELPEIFGTRGLDWQMLGNDQWGDCYWASAAHEVMAEAHLAGREPQFSTEGVLSSYAAYSGVARIVPAADRGTEPRAGAKYRKAKGIADAGGHGHRIGAYVFEERADYKALLSAIYTFGAITLCFELPESAERDFETGVWDYVKGSPILGGHAVAGVARAESGQLVAVSWGQEVEVTEAFVDRYLQVAMAYVSGSVLDGSGESPTGLDRDALRSALAEISA